MTADSGRTSQISGIQIYQPKESRKKQTLINRESFQLSCGAIIRGDISKKELALVLTGDEYADGAAYIGKILKEFHIKASFFLTGNFYRNTLFKKYIEILKNDGHYLGAHSDRHLLYCDWQNRDSLLISREMFFSDLEANYNEMVKFGINRDWVRIFLPPYEWYNQQISGWCQEKGLTLINFTPGTLSHADYTIPSMGSKYISSDSIYRSIVKYEKSYCHGLNGFILLMHIGTHPERTDKFYNYLPNLLNYLISRGYNLKRIDGLLLNEIPDGG